MCHCKCDHKYVEGSTFISRYKNGALCAKVTITDICKGKYFWHDERGKAFDTEFDKFEDFYRNYKPVRYWGDAVILVYTT